MITSLRHPLPHRFLPLLLLSANLLFADSSPTTISLDAESVGNLRLAFSRVEQRALTESVEGSGTVLLNERKVYHVTPKIDGVVSDVAVALGDAVNKGDALCVIQSAELARLITAYVKAEESMTFAGAALSQEKELAQSNLTSAEMLREKELAFREAVTEHARALQPLKLLNFTETSVHRYLHEVEDSDYTSLVLTAEGQGQVIEMNVRDGAAVDHDAHLFTVADLDELWIDSFVPLSKASNVSKGDSLLVRSTVAEQEREAKVIYVAPVADPDSRTVLVRAALPNEDLAWRPGTPVRVLSTSNASDTRMVVPASAIVDFQGGKAVFVKTAEATFLLTSVKTGTGNDDFVEVLEGLEGGETVVSQNAAQLKGHLEMTAE